MSSSRSSEFDDRAFAVVDQLFASSSSSSSYPRKPPEPNGANNDRSHRDPETGRANPNQAQPTPQHPATTTRKNNHHRLGVGAIARTSEMGADDPISAMATKRMMQVGSRKKRRMSSEYDEDEEQAQAMEMMDVKHPRDADEDDDQEEEAGRTTIAVERKQPKQSVAATLVQKAMEVDQIKGAAKKKKKKKKANSSQDLTTVPILPEQGSAIVAQENQSSSTTQLPNQPDDIVPKETDEEPFSLSKKRKRPKKRSRQKNIYKDTRDLDHKPAHLIPGATRQYQGRPLTAATRQKLHLPERPPPPPSFAARRGPNGQGGQEQHNNNNHHHEDAGDAVIVGDPLDSMPLAVDQVAAGEKMVNDGDHKKHEPVSAPSAKEKKSKRKKTKYKNLM